MRTQKHMPDQYKYGFNKVGLFALGIFVAMVLWSKAIKNSDPVVDDKDKFRKALRARMDCEEFNVPLSGTTNTINRVNLNNAQMPNFIDLGVPTRTQGAHHISSATACSCDSDIFTTFRKSSVRFSYPFGFGANPNLIGVDGTGKGSLRISFATVCSNGLET
ncbi:hypothetical protein H4Q26_009402 [Puccinia striiformis f. sp. tritici PST-130]|uniref:Uncharacterized protein n=2 Tax=Puccinia striiformis f. sp. tritici TaxID=168172 RepID=A0A0L0V9N6_9BASI|nr:hypothetical protein H4Q26_009402 [Puccinia striiformis f. sp. tritici PST-130]KNE95992.1 hypothetical protein PSTG_10683 [Puccinia striiformis f. sp. tritici PST-78]